MDAQLLGLERLAQLALDLHPRRELRPHLLVEDLDSAAARAPWPGTSRGRPRPAAARRSRSARVPNGAMPTLALTARSRPAIATVAPPWIASTSSPATRSASAGAHAGQHDRELVAAEAGERVGRAQPAAQRVGDAGQQRVAGRCGRASR